MLLLAFASFASAQTTADESKISSPLQEAANALIDAAEKYDEAALVEILDQTATTSFIPANRRAIAKRRRNATEARVKNHVAQPKNSRRAFLSIGDDDWPFRCPL